VADGLRAARQDLKVLFDARWALEQEATRLAQQSRHIPRATLQELLVAFHGKAGFKRVLDALAVAEREAARLTNLVATAKELARVEHWMAKRGEAYDTDVLAPGADLDPLLRQVQTVENLLHMQEPALRQLKQRAV
jgi:hypothetical protein